MHTWGTYLRDHPDRAAVDKTLHGIKFGERIGFRGKQQQLLTPNHKLQPAHMRAIDKKLSKLLHEGTVLGPFKRPPSPHFRCSPLKVVPKDRDDWRVCHDLSSPIGRSVNDGVLTVSFFPPKV